MNLKNLYTPRTPAKLHIYVALVSAFFLAIATYITHLQIPNIQDDINNEDSVINELRHQMTKDLIQGLYAAAWEKALVYLPEDPVTIDNLNKFIYNNPNIPKEIKGSHTIH